jgi:hypothetical protein
MLFHIFSGYDLKQLLYIDRKKERKEGKSTDIKLTSSTRFCTFCISGYFPHKFSFSTTSSSLWFVGFISDRCHIMVTRMVISSTLRFSTLDPTAIWVQRIIRSDTKMKINDNSTKQHLRLMQLSLKQ